MRAAAAEQDGVSPAVQTALALAPWLVVTKGDQRARLIADRHYSRQTPGSPQFMPPAETLVLVTPCMRALWTVALNLDPAGTLRWRNTYFRNEGAGLSSDLIRAAYVATLDGWRRKYGAAPPVRLTTEVDPLEVASPNPGYCFRCAGWERLYVTDGSSKGRRDLVVFGAPLHEEAERV